MKIVWNFENAFPIGEREIVIRNARGKKWAGFIDAGVFFACRVVKEYDLEEEEQKEKNVTEKENEEEKNVTGRKRKAQPEGWDLEI